MLSMAKAPVSRPAASSSRSGAAAGLDLVLAARSAERLESLGQSLKDTHGIGYRVITADLSRPEGASTIIDATKDLDVGLLVSNAGGGRPGLYLDQDLDELHRRLSSTPPPTSSWSMPSASGSPPAVEAAS